MREKYTIFKCTCTNSTGFTLNERRRAEKTYTQTQEIKGEINNK